MSEAEHIAKIEVELERYRQMLGCQERTVPRTFRIEMAITPDGGVVIIATDTHGAEERLVKLIAAQLGLVLRVSMRLAKRIPPPTISPLEGAPPADA